MSFLQKKRPKLGGRLLSDGQEIDGIPASYWIEDIERELQATGRVRVMTRTTITGAYDDGSYGALERVARHVAPADDLPPECFWRIRARQAVLAAGAHERPIAFPMNDRPGINAGGRGADLPQPLRRGAGAQRDHLRHQRRRAWGRTAVELLDAGVKVAAVIDSRTGVTARGDYRLIEAGRSSAPRGGRA